MVAILFESRIINKGHESGIYVKTKRFKELVEMYINYGENAIIMKSKEMIVNDRVSNVNIKSKSQPKQLFE